jgi:hypothetical protein
MYKEIQMGAVAKSYLRKGFLINEEMRKYLVIYEEVVSHMALQPLPSGFSHIGGKFSFLFYQCMDPYFFQGAGPDRVAFVFVIFTCVGTVL